MRARHLLTALGALFVLYFAVEGGEFGTSDLLRQRDRRAELETRVGFLVDAINATGREVTERA